MDHILKCHEIFKTDFVRGENCHLYDRQGRRYIDLESGIWSTALGHSHPRINQAMKDQIEKVIHLGTRYPNFLAEEAAIEVLKIVGIDEGKCVFLSSGSEAVEFAVQTVRRITGKSLLLTFTNSYLAAYGSAGRKSNDEWHLLDWNLYANTDPSEYLKKIPFDKIGGFIFEPGASGMSFVKFPPKELVQNIVQRIKQENGFLVANEVTAGMGRTGKWFGFQHYDVQPDIVASGKGIGNGYPVSVVAMKQEIAEKLENSGFHYAQSHQNDPLGCAVVKEVIAVFRTENMVERGKAVGEHFLKSLKLLREKYSIVKEARGRGMLLALEFQPHQSFSATSAYHALLEKGFLVGYYPAGNILRLSPALTIEEDDITQFLASMDSILCTVIP